MQIVLAVALAINRLAAADFSGRIEEALDPESIGAAALAYEDCGGAWCSHCACCSGRVAARQWQGNFQGARLTATATEHATQLKSGVAEKAEHVT